MSKDVWYVARDRRNKKWVSCIEGEHTLEAFDKAIGPFEGRLAAHDYRVSMVCGRIPEPVSQRQPEMER